MPFQIKPIREFLVRPSLPPALSRMSELAYNIVWSWEPVIRALFRRLDLVLWRESGYNFAAVGSNPVNGLNTIYVVGAAPVVFGRTGKRRLCSTDKNVIRVDLNVAGSTVPPDAVQCESFSALGYPPQGLKPE